MGQLPHLGDRFSTGSLALKEIEEKIWIVT
jgi:hypothetical protein